MPSVTIGTDGTYRLNGAPIERAELPQRLSDALGTLPLEDQIVIVHADSAVPYGRVRDLMTIVRETGFQHVGRSELSVRQYTPGSPGGRVFHRL